MRRAAAALLASIAIAASARAEAYCRSAACPARPDGSTDGHVCLPAQVDDCGTELQWRQPCIGFNVVTAASKEVDFDTAEATLAQAFAAWTAVDCGGGAGPSIQIFDLGATTCGKLEYNQHAGNANILVFRDKSWPHQDDGGGSTDTIALTTVTYDVQKGDIYDADIEVNTANFDFSTSDPPLDGHADLLSVLTHEAGHFLGLAHSGDPSTMFPDYMLGTDAIRTLAPDDEQAICAAYPPNREATGDCTGIPRHGFAPECVDQQTYARCAAAPGGRGAAADAGAIALALALAAVRRSTGRRGSRGS